MGYEIVEAKYQRAVFKGSEDTLRRDFILRYGERWSHIWNSATEASEEDVDGFVESLIEMVVSRIDDVETAALYAAYGRSLSLERELEIGMALLGKSNSLEKLLKWGLAMHFSDEVVAAPPYLAKLLMKLAEKAPKLEVDVLGELSSADGPTLAQLEGLLAGDFDAELHKAIYSQLPTSFQLGQLAVYTPEVGLVVNPLFSREELLTSLLELKKRRADLLAKALSLHGEYEFSADYRCGVQYLSIDGSLENSGVVAICPWMSYARRLGRLHNLVLIVEGRRPPNVAGGRGVIYVEGGEVEVVKPPNPSKLFNYLIDILYSVGFVVLED